MSNPLKQLAKVLDSRSTRYTAVVLSVASGVVAVRGPNGMATVSSNLAISVGDRVVVEGGVVIAKVSKRKEPTVYQV